MRATDSRLPALDWWALLICFCAGAAAVCAFAPLNLYPLAFISLAVLFYYWNKLDARACFWVGIAYGYGLYGLGVSWVYVSLSTYGGMPFWMGSIAVLGFAGILALIVALAGFTFAKLFPQPSAVDGWLALPSIWVIFEWLKSWVLTGFPWLDMGYTQTPSWLFGFASLGGVYFVSFAVALLAVAVTYSFATKRLIVPGASVAALLVLSLLANSIDWSRPLGQPIQVGVVQGNVPIDKKWLPDYRNEVIDKYASLSARMHAEQATDLIVWPETALPLYLQQIGPEFWRSITPAGSTLLTGIIESPKQGVFYNSAALDCGDGLPPQVYRKRHLVPFGEYLPLRFLFNWVLDYLNLPMSDSTSWQGQQPMVCGEKINIGLSICYEDAFAAEYRAHVGRASVLVNISEDAWFGDSLAPHQRLQMAQMRARELSRPLVRSANSGPSVVIDHSGEVIAISEQFEVQTINQSVQPQTGETPFKRFGNWIIALSAFLIALLVLLGRRRAER